MGVVDYKTQTLKPRTSLVFEMEKLHIYVEFNSWIQKAMAPNKGLELFIFITKKY